MFSRIMILRNSLYKTYWNSNFEFATFYNSSPVWRNNSLYNPCTPVRNFQPWTLCCDYYTILEINSQVLLFTIHQFLYLTFLIKQSSRKNGFYRNFTSWEQESRSCKLIYFFHFFQTTLGFVAVTVEGDIWGRGIC